MVDSSDCISALDRTYASRCTTATRRTAGRPGKFLPKEHFFRKLLPRAARDQLQEPQSLWGWIAAGHATAWLMLKHGTVHERQEGHLMRPHPIVGSALTVVLSIGFALAAAAQSPAPPGKGDPAVPAAARAAHASVPASDRRFADKAALAGMREVAAGKLAEQKATDEQVKQFGQRMVHDHGEANDRLRQMASSKGLDLPTKLSKKPEKTIDQLEKLSGHQFDSAYMNADASKSASASK
jgi:putative membrane protein